MSKISINLPENFIFSTIIPIRITDINYGNHLGNDSVLTIAHEARVQFLASHGFSEIDIDGCGIIMSDAAISFKSQGVYGQSLKIEIAIDDPSASGCDLIYRIYDNESGRDIAIVKTGLVFYNYERQRPTRMPAKFKTLIKS